MLHTKYDPDNVFAKILAQQIPAARIAESHRTLAIMDAFPQSRGHCLVIPKSPVTNILDVSRKDLSALIDQTQTIAQAVDKALSPDGIIITQFNGAPAGQTVFHLHFHIIPRYTNQDLAAHAGGAGEVKKSGMDELKALATLIRSHIKD